MRWILCLVLPVAAFLSAAALMAVAIDAGKQLDLAATGFSWEGEGADPARVMVAHYQAQANLVLLTVAFTAVAVGSIWMSYESASRLAPQNPVLWIGLMALFAVAGAVLVALDPIGPMVGCDVRLDSPCGLGHRDVAPHVVAAYEGGLVGWGGIALASGLILFAGTLAGPLVAAILLYFVEVARPGVDAAGLRLRKEGFLRTVVVGSIALSLGVAMVDSFLHWAIPFLEGGPSTAAGELAGVGTMFWGTSFALFSVLSAAMAALMLNRGINQVAQAQDAPEDWRSSEGLDFDPLRSAVAITAALGPVLTSSVLTLVGGFA